MQLKRQSLARKAWISFVVAGVLLGTLQLAHAQLSKTDGTLYGAATGAWSATAIGLVAEGANIDGAFRATAVGTGKFRNIVCTCRVAGSGGTNGIFVEMFAGGIAGANCELSGGDANACNDTAGTVMFCDINTTIAASTNYSLQFKNTTDCATNPTDCTCNIEMVD